MKNKPVLNETALVLIVCAAIIILALIGRTIKYRSDIIKDPMKSFANGTKRLLSATGFSRADSAGRKKNSLFSNSSSSLKIIRTYYFGIVQHSGPGSLLVQISNSQPLAITLGQKLFEGDSIRTADQSELLVDMDGAGVLQAVPNTVLRIDSSGHDNYIRRLTKIRLESGSVKVKIIPDSAGMRISSGETAVYIESGHLTVEYSNGATRAASLQGSSTVFAAGVKVILKQNQATIVVDGKAPQEPFDLPVPPDQIKIRAH